MQDDSVVFKTPLGTLNYTGGFYELRDSQSGKIKTQWPPKALQLAAMHASLQDEIQSLPIERLTRIDGVSWNEIQLPLQCQNQSAAVASETEGTHLG